MPSPRRMRLLLTTILAGIIITLLWSSSHHRGPNTWPVPDATKKTGTGADRGANGGDLGAGGAAEAEAREISGRLREAEQKAKDLANSKSPLKPDMPSEVIGVGNAADGKEEGVEETREEHEAEQELQMILKKAPVIIFSKTYCPFSKKAKALLLQKYLIEPTPHVVELDVHPKGPELQALLGEKTGRSTVPNVMVNGISIGGGDDVIALDVQGELVRKVQELGEARKVEMKVREGN